MEKMEKQFGQLSEFKGRDVELYISADPNNTAIYFTEVDRDKMKEASAYFQLLRFGLDGGDHQIYIRFPNTDYFVEMHDGGFGSGRGTMTVASGKNIHGGEYKKDFTIHSHDKYLMLSIGNKDLIPEFNFMTKVAFYNKGNRFDTPYPNETSINLEFIEEALSMRYLKIPEHIRTISYCFKTNDSTPTYFVVDAPAYNFKYDNHRFMAITNAEDYKILEFQIKRFERFRDGGTTIITVKDSNDKEHVFFSPQKMFPTNEILCEKWDDIKLVPVSDEEQKMLIELLGLELEPVSKEENEL